MKTSYVTARVAPAALVFATAATVSGHASRDVAQSFGPQQCLSLQRLEASGTCALKSDCKVGDVAPQFDFAFVCEKGTGAGSATQRSFGMSDLKPGETFDTETKCDRCLSPSLVASTSAAAVDSKPKKRRETSLAQIQLRGRDRAGHRLHAAAKTAVHEAPEGSSSEYGVEKKAAYGPDNCVSTYRSEEGNCLIQTKDCQEEKLQNFHYGLTCVTEGGMALHHDFGRNAFGPEETFDTLIPCKKCLPPMRDLGEPAAPTAPAGQLVVPQATEPATFFGPGNCVSTYRSAQGTCVLKTQCTPEQVKGYMFGLTCVSSDGSSMKHFFGKDSFDATESFDTLIQCDRCLGPDDLHPAMARDLSNQSQVAMLTEEVSALERTVSSLVIDVRNLQRNVYNGAPAPAVKRLTVHVPEAQMLAAVKPTSFSASPQNVSTPAAQPQPIQQHLRGHHRHHHHRSQEKKLVEASASDASRFAEEKAEEEVPLQAQDDSDGVDAEEGNEDAADATAEESGAEKSLENVEADTDEAEADFDVTDADTPEDDE